MSRDHNVYNRPRVRTAKADDCRKIALNMREEDRNEIFHNSGSSPLAALERGFKASEICMVIVFNDEPIAMFGIVRNALQPGMGIPWMLATPELLRIKKSFMRRAREELRRLAFGFQMLGNMVWAGNSVHILWLKWLGFEILAPVTHNGQLFYPCRRSVDV